jgi:hypothetical protein
MLRAVAALADLVTADIYGDYEVAARYSQSGRLADSRICTSSWLPIWTEDTDFFGCGCHMAFQARRDCLGRLTHFRACAKLMLV